MKYTHNYMKIFLDTADTEVINEYFKTGLVDGVTTNPTLIMKAGKNPDEIKQYFSEIYGEEILYKPKFSGFNIIIWLIPYILIIAIFGFLYVRKKSNK